MDILNNKQFNNLSGLEQKMLYYMMHAPVENLPGNKENPEITKLGNFIKQLVDKNKITLSMDKNCNIVITELTSGI